LPRITSKEGGLLKKFDSNNQDIPMVKGFKRKKFVEFKDD